MKMIRSLISGSRPFLSQSFGCHSRPLARNFSFGTFRVSPAALNAAPNYQSEPKRFKIVTARQVPVDVSESATSNCRPTDSTPPINAELQNDQFNFGGAPIPPPFWQCARLLRKLGLVVLGSAAGIYVAEKRKELKKVTPDPTGDALQAEVQAQLEKKRAMENLPKLFLPPVSDEVFESTDNLCVIWVDSPQTLEEKKDSIETFISYVKGLGLPCDVTFLYAVRSAPMPTFENDSRPDHEKNALTVVLYKGQRKYHLLALPSSTPASQTFFDQQTDQLKEFFAPLSEEDIQADDEKKPDVTKPFVESVTYNTFREKVIEGSSSEHPVILQLMEDSCFLCFLIRPLINSISEVLKAHEIPVTIKRLNLDKNDFPAFCPIVRSTPTFVEYKGEISIHNGAPTPWKEYKPKEFISKLVASLGLSSKVRAEIEALEEMMQERFQKFGLLSIWNQELSSLQAFQAGEPLPSQDKSGEDESDFDRQYNKIVSDLMLKDVSRSDNLHENLKFLDAEISSVEQDCIAYAHMIGDPLMNEGGRFELIRARLMYNADSTETNPQNGFHDHLAGTPNPATPDHVKATPDRVKATPDPASLPMALETLAEKSNEDQLTTPAHREVGTTPAQSTSICEETPVAAGAVLATPDPSHEGEAVNSN